MASPAQYNVEFYEGDDWELIFRIRDQAGALVDLEGKRARSQVRTKAGDPVVIVEFDVTLPELGTVRLFKPGTQTEGTAGAYVYDVQLENEDGSDRYTPLAGKVKVVPQVTT